MQLEVMYFIHHFLTHTTLWEVFETEYSSVEIAPEPIQGRLFTGADGKVYMTYFPTMASKEYQNNYATEVHDTKWNRYTVVELS